MYTLKNSGFLKHDCVSSTCMVCEEFLQNYHELLQRVSDSFSDVITQLSIDTEKGNEFKYG